MVRQIDADRHDSLSTISTTRGARTSPFDADAGKLYVVVPRRADQVDRDGPEIWMYRGRRRSPPDPSSRERGSTSMDEPPPEPAGRQEVVGFRPEASGVREGQEGETAPGEISPAGSHVPLLEARNLGRRAGDGGWLLRDVRLAVRGGDRVGLLGPSGAGKTLLLRSLALLDPLDEGAVLRDGRVVQGEDVPSFRSAVVYLHQRPALFEGSVEANLRHPYSLKVHRKRRLDRDRIVDLLEGLGRDATFLEKSHRDLSGGEAQIVSLLRAIQLDPTVLLLDEPTASLDPASARAIEDLLGRWYGEAARERAYLWVTHDPGQTDRVTDRSLWMQAGRLGQGP